MDESRARARREFIRNHHPDRGGDLYAFITGLAAFDRAEGGPCPDGQVRVVAVARVPWWTRLRRALLGFRHATRPRVR